MKSYLDLMEENKELRRRLRKAYVWRREIRRLNKVIEFFAMRHREELKWRHEITEQIYNRVVDDLRFGTEGPLENGGDFQIDPDEEMKKLQEDYAAGKIKFKPFTQGEGVIPDGSPGKADYKQSSPVGPEIDQPPRL